MDYPEFCAGCRDAANLDNWLHDRQQLHIAKVTGQPMPPQGIGPDPAPRPIPSIPKPIGDKPIGDKPG